MPLIDNATQHYKDLTGEAIRIEIPEWGDDSSTPAVVYATPCTLADMKVIEKNCRGDDFERAVEVLLLKCRDSDGNRQFSREDKPKLMRAASSEVVARVAGKILGAAGELVEEMEGN